MTADEILSHPEFNDLDRHFARFLGRLSGEDGPELILAAALTSRRCADGAVCVDLDRVARDGIFISDDAGIEPIPCPDLETWIARLRSAPVVGRPGEFRPLILDENHRLYLQRYWKYEQDLAANIRSRAAATPENVDWCLFRDGVARLFPASRAGAPDWQKIAAFAAMRKSFCVISGGPGTGKTHTAVLLLALLLEQKENMRVALAAPTGKAAARLQESIQKIRPGVNCDNRIKSRMPAEAFTIHRLLGTISDSSRFRHHRENPLAVDLVIVDEASMVDLALMAKLLDAVPESARVILLGDRDQLASVEAGDVLAEICSRTRANVFSPDFRRDCERWTGEIIPSSDGPAANSPITNCVVLLQTNYRFDRSSGLPQLSLAINAGNAAEAFGWLSESRGKSASLRVQELPPPSELKKSLREPVLAGFGPVVQSADASSALAALSRFRILSAVRQGPGGVEKLNRLVEEILLEAGWITKPSPWYRGRPVMILRNDYNLRLFNGDIGIAAEDGDGQMRVHFMGSDQVMRSFLPQRLPEHQTSFAMTIHKSQGSEFDELLMILPSRDMPVLTRELIYTGLTRARERATIWADEAILFGAIARRTQRDSGLHDLLWKNTGDGGS